eukprot:NODE_2416_length_1205_cov_27.214533_g2203_i0.p1 GENE.NODE_2416_length_1205_cov_27.214533_g2203_i0~~NODE_2416_length_1205_cov_27.214533_g2203_i0.p1  ORF type:complete len:284 (-),score=92.52 NODE_2416_length_1205_cov_27.214533_g2203_i0:261-1112(-)
MASKGSDKTPAIEIDEFLSPYRNKARNLRKKLDTILSFEQDVKDGKTLTPAQLEKIASKQEVSSEWKKYNDEHQKWLKAQMPAKTAAPKKEAAKVVKKEAEPRAVQQEIIEEVEEAPATEVEEAPVKVAPEVKKQKETTAAKPASPAKKEKGAGPKASTKSPEVLEAENPSMYRNKARNLRKKFDTILGIEKALASGESINALQKEKASQKKAVEAEMMQMEMLHDMWVAAQPDLADVPKDRRAAATLKALLGQIDAAKAAKGKRNDTLLSAEAIVRADLKGL